MSNEWLILLHVMLFAVAFLYASVGHGGASGYLALGAIFGLEKDLMRPTALLLNLFVSLTAFIQFFRGRHFKGNIFWPLACTSVPMAFIGGRIEIDVSLYRTALGVLLLLPATRFLFYRAIPLPAVRKSKILVLLFSGGLIGLISGVIGIGGGILLSPLLLILKWAGQKETAAISALFIFVNSLAGLLGQWTKGLQFDTFMLGYTAAALAGGLCGAYVGAMKLNQQVLRLLLGLVLLFAAGKLIFTTA